MAIAPNYYSTQMQKQITVDTANPGYDGSGTLVDVVASSTNGSKVEKIRVQSTGSTTIGAINLFLHDGTTTKFYMEIDVPNEANRHSSETAINLDLPAGYILKASTLNSEEFNVFAQGGNY